MPACFTRYCLHPVDMQLSGAHATTASRRSASSSCTVTPGSHNSEFPSPHIAYGLKRGSLSTTPSTASVLLSVTAGGLFTATVSVSSVSRSPAHGTPSGVHVTSSAHASYPSGQLTSFFTFRVTEAVCSAESVTEKTISCMPGSASCVAHPSRPSLLNDLPHTSTISFRSLVTLLVAVAPRSQRALISASGGHLLYPASAGTTGNASPSS